MAGLVPFPGCPCSGRVFLLCCPSPFLALKSFLDEGLEHFPESSPSHRRRRVRDAGRHCLHKGLAHQRLGRVARLTLTAGSGLPLGDRPPGPAGAFVGGEVRAPRCGYLSQQAAPPQVQHHIPDEGHCAAGLLAGRY